VVIDNRPGAGTLIGLSLGAKAAPDGYTIQFGTAAGLAVIPALGGKMPFDPVKDFAPVGQMVRVPFVLVVHPSVPANSVKELIALAKAQPGKLNFGSPGIGTPNHLGGELLKALAGIDIVHVPYKGSGPAVTDVVAGQLQLMFSGIPQVSGFVKAGRLKLIAVATPTRTRVMPDAPAIAETLPGFDCSTWYGLLVPARTPAAIVTKINADMNKALAQPDVIQRLLDQGVETATGTPRELQQLMSAELKRWSTVIKNAGITVDTAQ
jgi:tripartite-type tricarboxylate transporter receptor subunit TctC